MINLKLIERQPRWRVAIVHSVARLVGVMVHVEGLPFGSSRNYRRDADQQVAFGIRAKARAII